MNKKVQTKTKINPYSGIFPDLASINRKITIDNIINDTDVPLETLNIRFVPCVPSTGKTMYHHTILRDGKTAKYIDIENGR